MKWYKHDPSAALAGMIGLTIEERGAYYTLIDLQYARAPHAHVTDELVIGALATRPQVWRRLKAALIAKGKVREIDGHLTANRVETQVKLVMIRGGFRGQIGENQGLSSAESIEAKEAKERKKESASRSPKKARARSLPENWQPQLKFDEAEEFERFKDYARANAKQYTDWDAAWRNWKRSPYRNKGENNVQGRRHGSVLDACDRLREKLNAQGSFAENYVPGSSGPKPLRLDQELRPANPRLISPR